jgi:hypothetical protein
MFVLPLHVYSRQSSSLSLCQIELNGTHVTNDCQGHSWPWLTMDKFPASACCCHVSMYLSSHDTFRLGSSRLISRRGKGRPGREHLSLSLSLSLLFPWQAAAAIIQEKGALLGAPLFASRRKHARNLCTSTFFNAGRESEKERERG